MSPIPKKTAMPTTIASVKDTVTHPQVRVHTVREAFSLPALYQRLGVSTVTLPPYSWLAPLLITLFATLLRFWNLAHPNAIVFDETYYAKDAYSMLHFGYEKNWSDQANDSFVAGNPTGISDSPEYVVHPPVGKWMIAFGMFLFGDNNPFGWRFSAALIGSLSIGLLMLAAWLLFRSISVASLAGLIMAVDGLHLVQSRFALLDIFLMFWLLAAFVCLLLDRQQSRRTLAQKVCAHSQKNSGLPQQDYLSYGPWLGVRYWRILAGICAGLAVGVKWNALFFIAIFGLMTLFWDLNARRLVGIKNWLLAATFKDGIPAFTSLIVLGLGVYLATWTGWFRSQFAYDRQWAANHPSEGLQWLPPALRSLWEYHRSAYTFHSGLDSPHTYQSAAWQWLLLGRPTSYYYESMDKGQAGCTVNKCSQAILNIGNPLLWWSFLLVILFSLIIVLIRRDWRFICLLLVFGAGYLPWFAYPNRTMFFFYALSFEPYLILMLAGLLGLALGRPNQSIRRRKWGLAVVTSFMLALLLISIFYWPIWTGQTIPYEHWRWRMWFDAWI